MNKIELRSIVFLREPFRLDSCLRLVDFFFAFKDLTLALRKQDLDFYQNFKSVVGKSIRPPSFKVCYLWISISVCVALFRVVLQISPRMRLRETNLHVFRS